MDKLFIIGLNAGLLISGLIVFVYLVTLVGVGLFGIKV